MSQNGLQETFQSSLCPEGTMDLFIETLTGTAFEMTVSPFDTIMSIKSKIQRVEGIPVSHQHLLYNLQELDDSSSLIDHSIQNGATLKLVLSMRGGPISTRRVHTGEEFTWKELREFMENGRDDMLDYIPPGCRVTVLVFRDGDQVNLFRVLENEDGTYSPLSESLSGSSIQSLFAEDDPEESAKRLQENSVTMFKMQELRNRMESLALRRKPKRSAPRVVSARRPLLHSRRGATARTAVAPPPPDALHLPPLRKGPGAKSRHAQIHPHASGAAAPATAASSSYLSSSSFLTQPAGARRSREALILGASGVDGGSGVGAGGSSSGSAGGGIGGAEGRRGVDPSNAGAAIVVPAGAGAVGLRPERQPLARHLTRKEGKESMVLPRRLASVVHPSAPVPAPAPAPASVPGPALATVPIPALTPALASDPSPTPLPKRPAPRRRSRVSAQILDAKPAEFVEYGAAHSFTSNPSIDTSSKPESSGSNSKASSILSTSKIAIVEQDPDSTLDNVETDLTTTRSSIVVPIPSTEAAAFAMSSITRERMTTSVGSGGRYRVSRFVLEEEDRPKTSPDKLTQQQKRAQEICDLLSETKWHSRRQRVNCPSVEELSSDATRDKGTASRLNSRRESDIVPPDQSVHFRHPILDLPLVRAPRPQRFEPRSNQPATSREKPGTPKTEIDLGMLGQRGGRRRVPSGQHLPTSIKTSSSLLPLIAAPSSKPAEVPGKKSVRHRCAQCRKRLNITNMYTCRCEKLFCSAHRYSELHECTFDYKSEGRKIIEQGNPLVTAPKLPKI